MKEECCEGTDCCAAQKNECCCNECCEETSHSKMIMQLANEAWSELMKEKMKEAYEKVIGDKMSKVAHVGVEACIEYWGSKMKEQSKCAEFEDKLNKAMS